MALNSKKYDKFYKTDGSGTDKIDNKILAKVEENWNLDKAEGCQFQLSDPMVGPLIYQLQQMQDELDSLRDEIELNQAKVGITSTQASNINTNNLKVSQGYNNIDNSTLSMTTQLLGKNTVLVFTISIPSKKPGAKPTIKTGHVTLI